MKTMNSVNYNPEFWCYFNCSLWVNSSCQQLLLQAPYHRKF